VGLAPVSAPLYREFGSPDGSYRVQVLVYPRRLPQFGGPGQGGDASGVVRLVDAQGRVVAEADVSPVNIGDRVTWSPGEVDVHLVAKWQLPAP
jgi:hypothetical protein